MSALTVHNLDGFSIRGAGTAFPPRTLDSAEVIRLLPETFSGGRALDADRVEFLAKGFEENVGVRERAWAHVLGTPLDHENEPTTVALGASALRDALDRAHLKATDLSLILVATSTPHRMTSTVSAAVGADVGADCAAMDTRAGCAGSLLAFTTACQFLAGGADHVAVIGTETFSKIVPPAHKIGALSLGDGAGALILSRGAGTLLAAFHRTDGSLGRLISTDGPLPPTTSDVERGAFLMSGDPDELLATIPSKYEEALAAVLPYAPVDGVDWFIPHQTSAPLIEKLSRRVQAKRTFTNISKHGNIGAAGAIVALAEAFQTGAIEPKQTILSAAVGGGMSWGAILFRMDLRARLKD